MTSHRALPIFSHEVDFAHSPNDPAKPTPTWTALAAATGYPVTSWNSGRGRQYELDRTEAGELTAVFDDTASNGLLPQLSTVKPLQRWRTYALVSPHTGTILNDGNSGLLYDPVSALTGNFDVATQTVPTTSTGGPSAALTSSTSPYLGTYCPQLTGGPSTTMSIGWFTTGKRVPVLPNTTYVISCMAYTTFTSATMNLGLTNGTSTLVTTLGSSTVSGAWVRLSGTYTTGSTETSIGPVANVTSATAQSNIFKIDCLQVEVVGRTNLCTNPSFSNGSVTGWAAGANVTLSVAAGSGVDGNAMLLTKGVSAGGFAYALFTNFTAIAGKTYTLSAYVRSTTGSPVTGTVVLADNGVQTVANFTAQTTWTRVSVTRTFATATSPSAYVTLDTAAANSTMLADDILLEMAPGVGDYFDGDSELCFWTGSHQASTAYMPNAAIPAGGTDALPGPIRYNAHPNPSFESGASGWSGSVTLTLDSRSCPYIGGHQAIRCGASTGGSYTYAGIPVQVTETLISTWVRVQPDPTQFGGSQSGTISIIYFWYTAGAALISSGQTDFTVHQRDGWVNLATVLTPPATAATVTLGLSWGNTFNGSSIFNDGWLVECYNQGQPSPGGSVTRPYFDNYAGAKVTPVFGGFVERWPNRIGPDLRAESSAVVIDGLGALAQIGADSEYQENVRDSAPLLYWPMGEGQGATTFADITGNYVRDGSGTYTIAAPPLTIDPSGNATGPGTQAGQPGPHDSITATSASPNSGATLNVQQVPAFGDSGTAVEFSGVSATNATALDVDIPNAVPPAHNEMAVECWIYPTATGVSGSSTIIGMLNGFYGSPNIHLIMEGSSALTMGIGSGANFTWINLLATMTLNTWHHVAVSRWWNGSAYQAVGWVDGVAMNSGTVAATTAAGGSWGSDTVNPGDTVWGRITVGGQTAAYHGSGQPIAGFPGRIAHVAVYTTVLTNDEVAQRYWHGRRGGIGETASWRARRYLNRYYNQPWQVEGAAAITTAVAAAATTAVVDSVLGFAVGDNVILTNGAYSIPTLGTASNFGGVLGSGANYEGYAAEAATLDAVDATTNTLTFHSPLAHAHSIGTLVMKGTQLSDGAAVSSATKLLPVLQSVEVAEQGRFFAKADGRPYFMLRKSRFQSAGSVAKAEFIQIGTHGVPYLTGAEWDYDPTLLFNAIKLTQTYAGGTTTANAVDTTSIAAYFRRDLSIDMPVASLSELTAAATDFLNTYKAPVERVQEITVDLYANPEMAEKVLGLELGDYVYVVKFVIGATASHGGWFPMVVEHIAVESGPGVLSVTLRVAPGSKSSTYAYTNLVSYR